MNEPLSVRQRMMLGFERQHFRSLGAKENAISWHFGETPTLYAARLDHLIDHPGALVYDPQTVRRLQRLREKRRAVRRGGFEAVG